jgi:transcriptional regulator with XRE-family HTH domain
MRESSIKKVIRTNLRTRRIELGMPQREVGERCRGITQQAISKYERGRIGPPPIEHLVEFANALQTTIDALIRRGSFKLEVNSDADMRHRQMRRRAK